MLERGTSWYISINRLYLLVDKHYWMIGLIVSRSVTTSVTFQSKCDWRVTTVIYLKFLLWGYLTELYLYINGVCGGPIWKKYWKTRKLKLYELFGRVCLVRNTICMYVSWTNTMMSKWLTSIQTIRQINK